jgi:phosphatidylinositol glycan class V
MKITTSTTTSLVQTFLFVRVVATLLIIVVANILPDHEAEGVERFQFPFSSKWTEMFADPFVKWDSIHFLNIALKGYQNDYQFAFYPAYPYLLGVSAKIFIPLQFLTETDMMVCRGTAFSLLFSLVSLILLREILKELDFSPKVVNTACVVFIFNPAFIFFVSLYTESCFTMFSWLTFYLFLKYRRIPYYLIPLIVSCTIRSNGILTAIPILSVHLMETLVRRKLTLKAVVFVSLTLVCSILPYLSFSYYAFSRICSENLFTGEGNEEFCQSGQFYLTYSHLQKKYWNVGFLSSFQFRQIPNIMLATPILLLSFSTLFASFNEDIEEKELVSNRLWISANWNISFKSSLLPWKFHLLVTTLLGLFMAHIQISTRLICSSSILIYVGIAKLLEGEEEQKGKKNGKKMKKYITIYLFLYVIGGSILHTNFYPWT